MKNKDNFGNNAKYAIRHSKVTPFRKKLGSDFKIIKKIALADGKKCNLSIDNYTIENFFLNSSGNIDESLLDKFLEIYKFIYEKLYIFEQEKTKSLHAIIESNENITSLNVEKDVLNALSKTLMDENRTVTFLQNIIDTETKKKFSATFDFFTKFESKDKYKNAYNFSERIFVLSSSDKGYDFSNLEEKFNIIYKISKFVSFDEDDYFDEFAKYIRDEKNNINLNFADKLATLCLTTLPEKESISGVCAILKDFCSKDRENEDIIFSCMLELAKIYPLLAPDERYQKAFRQSFNKITKKFDIKKFKVIKEIITVAEDRENFDKYPQKEYLKKTECDFRLILRYFDKYCDETTGNLKENIPNIKTYYENYEE